MELGYRLHRYNNSISLENCRPCRLRRQICRAETSHGTPTLKTEKTSGLIWSHKALGGKLVIDT